MVTTTPTLHRSDQIAHSGHNAGPTNNDQYQPKTVALDDGRFVVIWTDNSDAAPGDADGLDILAQVFDAWGDPVGAVTQVNASWFIDDEENFDVAAAPGGKFIIVYEDNDIAGGSIRAEEVTVNADHTMSFVFRSIQADDDDTILGAPAVAVRPNGDYLVTYSLTESGSSTTARGVIVSRTGDIGASFPLVSGSEDYSSGSQNDAVTLSNGNYVTVHTHLDGGGDRGLYIRIVDRNGLNVLGATEVVTTSSNSQSDTAPVLAALANGGFVLAWTNNDGTDTDILFQRYNNNGDPQGSLSLVNGAALTDNNNEPIIVALADGGFIIVYDDDVDDAIKGQRFDSNGVSVGSEFTIADTAGTESAPTVTATADGRIVVAWVVNNGGDNDIRMSIWDPRDAVINGDENGNLILARAVEATTINGLDGDDSLYGFHFNDTLRGNAGNDYLEGGSGEDSLLGGAGDDTISGGVMTDTMDGGHGIDTVDFSYSGSAVDIDIGAALATFNDGSGIVEDIIDFENVIGSSGANMIDGTNDANRLLGGGGNDTVAGYGGDDTIAGQSGDDTVRGGGGDDNVFGNGGNDRVYGGSGDDTLTGSAGLDTMYGGAGNDRIYGNADNDRLIGEDGDDLLVGLGGADQIFAGQGDDTLKGGAGDDTMSGGAGADVFEFESGTGNDLVNGFSSAQGDRIFLKGFGAAFDSFADVQAAASQVGSDTVIDLGGGNTVTLANVNLASLTADDFLFG